METIREGKTGKMRGCIGCAQQQRKRITRWLGGILSPAWLLLWPCLVLAQANYDLDAAAVEVADQLAQRFLPLQGEVVEVQGEQLYLSLGARDQVLKGVRLNVFREGDELTSPTTGEVLGRLEEDLGTVTVTQVAEAYAVAVLTNPAGEAAVQAGDKVRITAGRLSLCLLPVNDQTGGATRLPELSDAVQHGLNATGRFHVVPRARLTIWLLERGLSPGDVLDPAFTSEAADAMGVTYFAQPVLRNIGDTTVVELRLFAPDQPQTPVTTALAVLPEAAPMRQQSASSPVLQPPAAVSTPPTHLDSPTAAAVPTPVIPAEGPTALQSLLSADPLALEKMYVPLAQFPTELRGFDTADIDGDGRSELVMLSDTKVLLYHVQENQLAPVASYSDRRPGTLLSVQLVRLDDGQTPGVVINRYSPNRKRMDSFFLVLQGRQLVLRQKGLSDILLAVDTDGDGVNESLWGQRFDGERFFRHGQVRQYDLQSGRLKRQRKLALPATFRATGAALAQLGAPGNRQLVFVGRRHNLQIYEGKARRWMSPAGVGGSYVFAALEMGDGTGIIEKKLFDFEAIPAVADFDGDGIDEVLVPRNQSQLGMVPNLNLYSGGHVVLMRQTPQGFALSPISPEFDGVVSGVAVLKGRTPGILVAVSKREGVLKQKKQTILYLNRL